jgi:hypothetical protein
MTPRIKPQHPASLLVDYPCPARHQVEIDLADMSVRAALQAALTLADEAHAAACAEPPRRIYRHSDTVLVRAHIKENA